MAFYWISLHGGEPAPLTIRILSKTWDVHYDVGGGNRIPRISERKARTVAELRAAGVGVRRVLMVHDNTHRARDLFDAVLTMLDPDVVFDIVHVSVDSPNTPAAKPGGASAGNSIPGVFNPGLPPRAISRTASAITTGDSLLLDIARAEKIGREVTVHYLQSDPGSGIVKLVLDFDYDLLVIDAPETGDDEAGLYAWQKYVREHASCVVSFMSLPAIQREVVDSTPSSVTAS